MARQRVWLRKQLTGCVWLRKQLKGTAWLSAVSSQSGRDTRGARVLQVDASCELGGQGGKNQGLRSDGVGGANSAPEL